MTTTTQPPTPPPTPPASTRPGVWAQLKPLVLRLHFYAGVFIAPFILIAAVTGLIYTAAPNLENIVYADQLKVEPGQAAMPLSEQVAVARDAHPDGDLVEVRPPVSADGSTRVVFIDDTVPADYNKAVFVDPYTNEVLGQEKTFGQWLGVRAWIDDLHRNLHLGAFGRNYSELAASWLWVVVLGGLALWFTKRRSDRRARRLLLPETSAKGRRRTLSWHATIGVWVALGALLLSSTGLTWSRHAGANIGEIRQSLSWTGTSLSTSLDGSGATDEHAGHAGHGAAAGSADAVVTDGVGIDGAVASARAAGLRDPLVVTPPADAASAWSVSENKRSAPTRSDSVAIDPATGQVVDKVAFADQPFMAKLTDWTIDAHMGILFGLANQLVLAAIAIGLILVVVQGYRSWWQRRPTRGGRAGRAPVRGSWRRLSPGVLVGVVVVVAAVGWFVPLLGVTLVAFLVVDTVVGRRATSTETGPGRQHPRSDELKVERSADAP
ncbi:PepSY domain-containing protein [Aeromicrobium fastidiosum]|uniref:PepSY-associated TM helix domain-containing protein n=1 Tax=Aeromicrobium fastidiosum TaxID=52699 RepID=UPI0020235927|nr:PepSY domain-containing protein [Aeromicrobium fastidiosum]MCL8250520.1 PepSY domain-containing protein [Aeromicrobium fastidiosum]